MTSEHKQRLLMDALWRKGEQEERRRREAVAAALLLHRPGPQNLCMNCAEQYPCSTAEVIHQALGVAP